MADLSLRTRNGYVDVMDDQPEPPEPNVLKRAFDIAPECGSIAEVKRRLIREGYMQVNAHLSGWQIRREILARLNRQLSHQVPKRIQDP